MPKVINVKIEETYQIPDDWDIVQNDEGITKIKVNENEYYDFGTIPFKLDSLESGIETMLNLEEYDEIMDRGLDLTVSGIDIVYADNNVLEEFQKEEEEPKGLADLDYDISIFLKQGAIPNTFKAHWNDGAGILSREYEKYVKNKKQTQFSFNMYQKGKIGTSKVIVDFSEVAYIQFSKSK